jgi:hypothetical protein
MNPEAPRAPRSALAGGIANGRRFRYNGVRMRLMFTAFFLLGLLSGAVVSRAQEIIPAGNTRSDEPQEIPAGISCCDEQKIRLAMTEEALARIIARSEADSRESTDYLSGDAYKKIRKRLPPGSLQERLNFLRDTLGQPAPDADEEEFQTLVGHFILGMTLEIGQTLQDEYDQALASKGKVEKLLEMLEHSPDASAEDLDRLMFQADITEREMRRLRALKTKWQTARVGSPPFDEFNSLKKNVTGRVRDPDQRMVFELAERYRDRFPFLDEFMKNYRILAKEFHADLWNLNDRLAELRN